MTIRFATALALAALLGAPAARAADAPAPAAPAPALATLEALRASMLASDSILVTRVELSEQVTTDSTGEHHTSLGSKRVALNNVKGRWMKRLVANLLPAGTVLSPELCASPTGTAGLPKPWMLSALWVNKDGRGQVYINLLNGCGFAGLRGGRPAGFTIGAGTDSLLALFQQALYADTLLATVKSSKLPDTTHAFVPPVIANTDPEAIERVAPVYPDSARHAGIQGTVVVKALVSSEGHVLRADVQDSVPALDAAAIAAVKKWRFKPATVDGKPRAVWVTVPVNFALHAEDAAPKPKH
jgi:protein TonB